MFPFSSPAFTPEIDIPSLAGKTIVITGSNGGLGYESIIHLAKHRPSRIYLCARTQEKYNRAIQGISATVADATAFVKYLQLDLASLDSVRRAAATFTAENGRLDVLMNNAGIMAQPPALTVDGFEIQFGTNHVGHALFTKLLLPVLLKTAAEPDSDVRIINISSDLHKLAPRPLGFLPEACLTDMSSYSTWTRYGQSKLANILFTTELAHRHPSITSLSIHPGGVATNLMDQVRIDHPYISMLLDLISGLIMVRPPQGAWNQVWAAAAPVAAKDWTRRAAEGAKEMTEVKNGAYYTPVAKEGGQTNLAKDAELAARLWEWTEQQLKARGY